MIALKREVAAGDQQVFRGANVKLGNWRQVTVQTESSTTGKEVEMTCVGIDDTHGRVYSHRLSYSIISTKRRRLFLWQVK